MAFICFTLIMYVVIFFVLCIYDLETNYEFKEVEIRLTVIKYYTLTAIYVLFILTFGWWFPPATKLSKHMSYSLNTVRNDILTQLVNKTAGYRKQRNNKEETNV